MRERRERLGGTGQHRLGHHGRELDGLVVWKKCRPVVAALFALLWRLLDIGLALSLSLQLLCCLLIGLRHHRFLFLGTHGVFLSRAFPLDMVSLEMAQ